MMPLLFGAFASAGYIEFWVRYWDANNRRKLYEVSEYMTPVNMRRVNAGMLRWSNEKYTAYEVGNRVVVTTVTAMVFPSLRIARSKVAEMTHIVAFNMAGQ